MKKKDLNSPQARRWIGCPVEETYFGENRKEGKEKRKMAMAKDRSKYKKTDQEKYLKGLEKSQEAKRGKQDWLEGRVITIVSQGIVIDWQGERITCVLKGLLKKEKTHAKNLVAVGDYVLFEKTSEHEGVISHVKPRRTLLSRADNLSRRKEQLIAVNVDQVIITVSVVNPPLKCAIIDRYIIAARKGAMTPVILINKIDLLHAQSAHADDFITLEREMYQEAIRAYQAAGISLISVSVVENMGVTELREVMTNKTSVFSGPSGVGKSSLINVVTGLDLRTGEVVEKTKKGSHTTSTTQLIPLSFGGWCVDTPGIKSFGVWDLKLEEVESYFTEIHEFGANCKFSDCTHAQEEQCAVQRALEKGELSPLRYLSYQALRESVGKDHVRR